MENFTVIYDDEDVMGKVLDIRKCFIKQLGNDLLDINIGIEDKINQLNLVQELLEKLQEENNETIIKVSFNPMGEFYYKYIDWSD